MGKAIKGVMGVVAVLIVIVLIALWYVLGNLDRLVEAAIERVGPQVTGTSVLVSGVSISLKEGRGEISGLTIGNPDGFESPHALRIGKGGTSPWQNSARISRPKAITWTRVSSEPSF